MKKFLSAILVAALMVCTLAPIASAEIETITLPTAVGESVQLEAENYIDQYKNGNSYKTYSVAEMEWLSGGKGAYSGWTSNETETLTFPLSVSKDVAFELECVAGFGGHLDQNYWTIDGKHLLNTSLANGTAVTDDAGNKCFFTDEAHYPAGLYTANLVLSEGTHELTYNIPKRSTMAGAFALDYVKLTATDAVIPEVYFAEGATACAYAKGKTAIVSFSDSGVENLDGVETKINYYYIEIFAANTTSTEPVATTLFEAYVGDIAPYRPESYTAAIPLNSVMRGPLYAKIYPVSPSFSSVMGEPLETAQFTVPDPVSADANRYEFENFWNVVEDFPNPVLSTPFGSNDSILLSAQTKLWGEDTIYIHDTTSEHWQDTYTLEFNVELPADDTYDVKTVMGKKEDGNVDLISVYVDEELIYTNELANASENLSVNGHYPWKYLYACRYNAEKYLTEGIHTVKVEINRPTVEKQPHLFMLDYIQFERTVKALTKNRETTFEMEDYAKDFVIYDSEGNTEAVNPQVKYSVNSGNGAFITKDYNPTLVDCPAKVDIPVKVETSGIYLFEAVDSSAACDGFVTLSNEEGTITAIEKFSSGVRLDADGSGLDGNDPVRSNFHTYYDMKWHSARKTISAVYVPAGEYTLTVQYNARQKSKDVSGMAFCIDYLKVSPFTVPGADVAAEGVTTVEMEDYAPYFLKNNTAILDANIVENEKASGGVLATLTEIPLEDGHYLTLPVHVEKAGWYYMDSVISLVNGDWTSLVSLSVNGETALTNEIANSVEDLSEPTDEGDKKIYGYLDDSYRMHRFSNKVYLEEGKNEVQVHAFPRKAKTDAEKTTDEKLIAEGGTALPYRVCYFIDYIAFKPVSDDISFSGEHVTGTLLYPQTTGSVLVAGYCGTQMVGLQLIPLADESIAEVDFICNDVPDTIKAFLVNGLADIKPIATEKVFDFTN